MEIEKTLTIAAGRQRIWELLLDPKVMAGCVPGTESVEVISDVEYVADIKVKISFIAARFRIRTRIMESRPPEYLRIEGTGEDRTVASAMTQTSELFLSELADGRTELRIQVKAEVQGRLGSFGLSVMQTKADRMWEEFGDNLSAVATRSSEPPPPVTAALQCQAVMEAPQARRVAIEAVKPERATFWRRIVGAAANRPNLPAEPRLPTDIYVEVHHGDCVIKVLWPGSAATTAAEWLKDIQR